MRISLLLVLLFTSITNTFSQDTVTVVEKTIRIASLTPINEYYGFAKGDKVIFNFWVEKGKELKDITVSEYPNSVKFAEHTIEKIENKILEIPRNGIYRIEYNNSNILPRVVNVRIQRIPSDPSLRAFNTGVKWVEKVDTSFRSQQTNYELKSDTSFQVVLDTIIHVNAKKSTDNLHRTIVDFFLPPSTIRWAYWMGVGDKGVSSYEEDRQKFTDKADMAGSPDPLKGVALGLTRMTQVSVGDRIRYFFISKPEETTKFLNGTSFGQFRQGEMVTDFGLMNYPNKNMQQYYIGLSNDNTVQAMAVRIKILAVVVVKEYEAKGENVPTYITSRVPVHAQ
jgi:hypothetical protein